MAPLKIWGAAVRRYQPLDLLRFTQVGCLFCASSKGFHSCLERGYDPLAFKSEGQISTKFVVVVVVAAVESKWRCLISAAAAAAGSAMSSNDAAADEVLTLAIAVVVVVAVAVVALAVVVVVIVEVVVRLVDGRLLEELARRESEQV